MPEELICPQCQSAMTARAVGNVTVRQCSSCSGLFLARTELGELVEAENDWHRDAGPLTQPLPRITPDMTAPPPARLPARSYLETLFR